MTNIFSDLTLPAKLIISAVLGLIAGPGLVGFVNEYAAYNFALHEGVRPPLEGIPYLTVAVTTATFLLLCLAAITFLVLLLALRGFTKFVSLIIDSPDMVITFNSLGNPKNDELDNDNNAEGNIVKSFRSLSFSSIFFLFVSVFLATLIVGSTIQYNYGSNMTVVQGVIGALIISSFVFFSWRSEIAWLVAVMGSIAICLTVVIAMLIPHHYGMMLRYLRYGGGIPIGIDFQEQSKIESISVYLVLRTSESVLVFDSKVNVIREIPTRNIKNMTYPMGSLSELTYKLPSGYEKDSEVAAQ